MPRDQTFRPAGVAAAVAAVGWVLSGAVRATLSGSTVGSGSLAELLVPATGGSLVHTGIPQLVLAGLAGALVVAAVVGLLAAAVLRAGAGGRTTVVLACWFAAVAGAVLGQLVSAALGRSASWLTVGNDLRSALWTGPYWGVVYGWVVGLVAVAVLRRAGTTLVRPAGTRAVGAAVTAGLVAAPAWALVGLAHRSAVEALGPGRSPALRLVSILLPNASTDYLDGSTAVVLLTYVAAALGVGAAAGAVTWLAARGADPGTGRLPFVLAVWLGAVLASSVGPSIAALDRSTPPLHVLSAVVPTSALWGLFYGWLVALAALLVLVRGNRVAAPVTQERLPAHRA